MGQNLVNVWFSFGSALDSVITGKPLALAKCQNASLSPSLMYNTMCTVQCVRPDHAKM